MASETKSIGARGKMRVRIDLSSQDFVRNTSKVRVRGDVWLDSGGPSEDNTGRTKVRFTGTNSTTAKTVTGKYTTEKRLLLDETFTVTHDSDGNKTVSYTFHFGPTITTNLGDGGSVSASMKLTQIATKPGKPSGLSTSLSLPNTITLFYSAPSSTSAIVEYQIEYATNSSFVNSAVVSVGTALSRAFSGLDKNLVYYFRVRARNSDGFGDWSDTVSQYIPNTPAQMAAPVTEFKVPATITVYFVAPDNGGSPITNYDVQYSTTSDFAQITTVTTTVSPLVFNNLTPDAYYFRVRANNLVGSGPWSAPDMETIISGPKINFNGTTYPTLAYVKYQGIYRIAIPYGRKDGIWRIAGG